MAMEMAMLLHRLDCYIGFFLSHLLSMVYFNYFYCVIPVLLDYSIAFFRRVCQHMLIYSVEDARLAFYFYFLTFSLLLST